MDENKCETSFPTTLEELKSGIIDAYDAFILDMDGVLWRVDEPTPGAKEALEYLISKGKTLFFATNNSLLRAKQYSDKLKRLNLGDYKPECIFCSSNAAATYLKRTGYKGKVYMIGGPALRDELLELDGIELNDGSEHNGKFAMPADMINEPIDPSIGAIVMGFDPHFNYYKVAYATAILNKNKHVELIFTNADHQFPTQKWILPGTGAFVASIQVASGRKGVVAGKPGLFIIDELLRNNPHIKRDKICMIGDNISTDIIFGKNSGIGTVLVETGVHTREDLTTDIFKLAAPKFVIPSIADLNLNKTKQ